MRTCLLWEEEGNNCGERPRRLDLVDLWWYSEDLGPDSFETSRMGRQSSEKSHNSSLYHRKVLQATRYRIHLFSVYTSLTLIFPQNRINDLNLVASSFYFHCNFLQSEQVSFSFCLLYFMCTAKYIQEVQRDFLVTKLKQQ